MKDFRVMVWGHERKKKKKKHKKSKKKKLPVLVMRKDLTQEIVAYGSDL